MATTQFNEAERYLLENWQEVADMRKCIYEMEIKQNQRLENIAKRAIDSLPGGLDDWLCYGKRNTHSILVRRKDWIGKWTGLWVENLSLEDLLYERSKESWASVHFSGFDDDVLAKCMKTAGLYAKKHDLWKLGQFREEKDSIWYPLPKTREELMRMLMDGKSEPFDECIMKHFELLAKLIPAVDEAMDKAKNSRPTA